MIETWILTVCLITINQSDILSCYPQLSPMVSKAECALVGEKFIKRFTETFNDNGNTISKDRWIIRCQEKPKKKTSNG